MKLSEAKDLSDDNLRVRVAETLGWEIENFGVKPPGSEDYQYRGTRPVVDLLPAFSTSLDAMHEAEKALSSDEWRDYHRILWTYAEHSPAHADVRLRASAFLHVKTSGETIP